jgi:hypothetical protein
MAGAGPLMDDEATSRGSAGPDRPGCHAAMTDAARRSPYVLKPPVRLGDRAPRLATAAHDDLCMTTRGSARLTDARFCRCEDGRQSVWPLDAAHRPAALGQAVASVGEP